jgi:hypothetical protein
MPLEQGNRAQLQLQGNEQDGRQGRPYFTGKEWGSFAIKNQGVLIISNQGGYVPPPLTPGAQIVNFAVTTSSGNITINWGDGNSEIVSSTVATSHLYYCPNISVAGGFWSSIQPC